MLYTLNCKGRLLSITSPIVMGIINATPDSFYTQGSYNAPDAILTKAEQMITEGATILDVGGMSTRPGAEAISIQEEIDRVLPAITNIRKAFPEIFISIDTYHGEVAKAALLAGADIINDISGANIDAAILSVAKKYTVPYILSHIQGTPKTMQNNPEYGNVVTDVLDYFVEKLKMIHHNYALNDIILDVGFGFGKKLHHNYELLKSLNEFQYLNKPILAGISRKSMLTKLLHINASEALNASTAAHMLALQQGANILRVHDVREAQECIQIYNYYQQVYA